MINYINETEIFLYVYEIYITKGIFLISLKRSVKNISEYLTRAALIHY